MKAKFAILFVTALLVFAPAAWSLDVLSVTDVGTPVNEDYLSGGTDFATFHVFTASPDGKWLAWASGKGNEISIIPVDGGEATMIYTYSQFPELDEFFYLHVNIIASLCFTPCSQEITFNKRLYDEEMGSEYEIKYRDDGSIGGFRGSNSIPFIESINIYTGEHRVITTGYTPQWDPTGRYLAYCNYDYRNFVDGLQAENHGALMVLDTVTEESRVIKSVSGQFTFTPDGQYIIETAASSEQFVDWTGNMQNVTQLFRYPINGGDPEQISFVDDDGFCGLQNPVCSPDGKWLFFSKTILADIAVDFNDDDDPNTGGGYSSTVARSFGVVNIETGEDYDLLPYSVNLTNILPLAMSPDGSKLYLSVWDHYMQHLRVDGERVPYIWIVSYEFNPESLTSFPTLVNADIPEEFATIANFPNPFNPSTTISFNLPEAGFTELIIYNMAGQKVRELISGELIAGAHQVVWDGRDNNGLPVSSGVFVTHLTSGENVVSNRMTLVK